MMRKVDDKSDDEAEMMRAVAFSFVAKKSGIRRRRHFYGEEKKGREKEESEREKLNERKRRLRAMYLM